MGAEIERKFLVDHIKWDLIDKPEGTQYRQGYLLNDGNETVRIRISDKKAFLNLKSKISEVSRKEYEYEIPLEDGVQIMAAFTKNAVEKTRYNILFKGKIWEVDVFKGDNLGLIVAEIELLKEDENFEKPEWATKEVTNDNRYLNASLLVNPYRNWEM